MKAASTDRIERRNPRRAAAAAGPGRVLVRVRACGLNRADLQMVAGVIHGQRGGAGTLAGIECAGEVVAAGPEAKGSQAG